MSSPKVKSDQRSMNKIEEVNEATESKNENQKRNHESDCRIFCNSFFYEFGKIFNYFCLCRLCCDKEESGQKEHEEVTFHEYTNDISMTSYRLSTNSNGRANSEQENNYENQGSDDENESHENHVTFHENYDPDNGYMESHFGEDCRGNDDEEEREICEESDL